VTLINEIFLSKAEIAGTRRASKPQAAWRSKAGSARDQGVMINTTYAIAVAAIAAALFVAFPSLSPQVGAVAPIAGAKGDRADIRPLGVDCGEKAWPYFDAACMRDPRIPLAQPRDIRIIAAGGTR
jgi:hypothetical protein